LLKVWGVLEVAVIKKGWKLYELKVGNQAKDDEEERPVWDEQ
jgi:hypothetical protein